MPAYKDGGFTATIEILTAHVETAGINVSGIDLSWITIIKENDTALDVTLFGSLYWFNVTNGGKSPRLSLSVNLIGGSTFMQALLQCQRGSEMYLDGAATVFDGGEFPSHILQCRDFSRVYSFSSGITFKGVRSGTVTRTIEVTDSSDIFIVGATVEGRLQVAFNCRVDARGCDFISGTNQSASIFAQSGSFIDLEDATMPPGQTASISRGSTLLLEPGSTISTVPSDKNNLTSSGIIYI